MDFDDDGEEADEGAPAWMATFSDMATLLLTFFVLLLSFANMDVTQFRTLMGSVREAFGVQFETQGDFMARSNNPIEISPGGVPGAPTVLQNGATLAMIRQRLREEGLDRVVEAEDTPRGVALRVRDAVLFESGSDILLEEARPLLAQLGEMAVELAQEVSVEGHTDNRPIHTARFPSNWELSAARATAVLRHLNLESDAHTIQMSIAGYADTHPISDNDTPAGRAANRRVELIFIRPPDEDTVEVSP